MGKGKTLYGDKAFNAYLADLDKYQDAKHADLIKLARAFLDMELGDLIRFAKDKAQELGSMSPSAVWVRAILFARLAATTKGEKL